MHKIKITTKKKDFLSVDVGNRTFVIISTSKYAGEPSISIQSDTKPVFERKFFPEFGKHGVYDTEIKNIVKV